MLAGLAGGKPSCVAVLLNGTPLPDQDYDPVRGVLTIDKLKLSIVAGLTLELRPTADAAEARLIRVDKTDDEIANIFVDASRGNDRGRGTKNDPLRSLERARDAARAAPRPTSVHLSGTFEGQKLELNSATDSGVLWQGELGEDATISGAMSLQTKAADWHLTQTPGVWELALPSALARRLEEIERTDNITHTHLFVNGRRAPRVCTPTMTWEAPLGVTKDLAYNDFCQLYGNYKLVPECFGFKFARGSISASWDVSPAALKKWRVKAYHAWCVSWHAVSAVDVSNSTITFSNWAENPFGAQIGSGGKRWLIEGAEEIELRAGSGQWRLVDGGATLQYAPLPRTLDDDYEPAAPTGHACRANATAAGSCDSVCCEGDCPGAVGQRSLQTCLQACEDAPQCRIATFWSKPHGPYCFLQRGCDEQFAHPDGKVVQTYRKLRTSPQRRRLGAAAGPGDMMLEWPVLQTVVAVGESATHISFSNLTIAMSRDSCALSPGGCSNVGRDGAGPAQAMIATAAEGTSFASVSIRDAGNAALYVGAESVTVTRSNFSGCGGNCVESTGKHFAMTHS
jgi:hypothetical protein